MLDNPRFAALFAPQPRGSADRRRVLGDRRASSGQVDRLVVTDDAVLIADYKTNAAGAADSRRSAAMRLCRQLALYRAVLAQLYPGRAIRAALIWTEVPDLMDIPPTAHGRGAIATLTPA